MTDHQPTSQDSDDHRAVDRQRLADLIGLLLARRWMSDQGLLPRRDLATVRPPRPAGDRLQLPPAGS